MTPRFPFIPLPPLVHALRPSQWTKNAVVLAAFFFAFGDRTQTVSLSAFIQAAAAAGLFCLLSSGVYLLNDIRDAEADRLHPLKRLRPIASGLVSVPLAGAVSALLLAVGLGAATALSRPFAAVAASYVILQLVYSFWLKHIALIDVFVIALGFVLRAVAGGVVVKVNVSPWLLLCAFLLALFLALCKRRHEKIVLDAAADDHRPSLGYYDRKLIDQLIAIVSAATIVCYSIYTLWPDTVNKFGTNLLSLTIPFVIFGVFRYLDLVYRREAGGRPERTLLTDRPLIVDLALYGLCVLLVFHLTRP